MLFVLLVLVVAGLIVWGAKTILYAPGMVIAEPFRTIIWVVIVLCVLFFCLQEFFGVMPGMPRLKL